MEQTITDEQRRTLMRTTMTEGMNAWAYVQSKPEEDRPWVAAGILSCMKKGYGLTVLEVNWAIRDLRRAWLRADLTGDKCELVDCVSVANGPRPFLMGVRDLDSSVTAAD